MPYLFEVHRLKPDWSAFLDDFQHHWPTALRYMHCSDPPHAASLSS